MSEQKCTDEIVRFPKMEHVAGSIGFYEKMMLGQLLFLAQPKYIIETGVFKGMTTRFVRDFLDNNNLSTSIVYGFDFPSVIQKVCQEAYFKEKETIQFVPGKLPESLRKFLEKGNKTIDFAIIDGDHSYEGVLSDLEIIEPYMSKNAIIFCHDYRQDDSIYVGTCAAIDEFCQKYAFRLFHVQSEKADVWGSAFLQRIKLNTEVK